MSNKNPYTCGVPLPSGCILYTGHVEPFLNLSCDASLDEAFGKHAAATAQILASIDLKSLSKKCFTFDPATAKVNGVLQELINKVCALEEKVEKLQAELDGFKVGDKKITLDLKCLKPQATPCEGPDSTYTLTSVLNILINKNCL